MRFRILRTILVFTGLVPGRYEWRRDCFYGWGGDATNLPRADRLPAMVGGSPLEYDARFKPAQPPSGYG